MFRGGIPPVDYIDPWWHGFQERLARLTRGTRHVAYFYERPDTSTFRYRVLNMIESLALADSQVGASWFEAADLPHLDAILDRADVLVLCRVKYSDHTARLVSAARARGLRILYDVDDLIFDDSFTHLIMDTLDVELNEEAWNFWFGVIARAGAVLRLCDGAILTNAFLAKKAYDFSGLPTSIIPNFLNAAQLDISERVLATKRDSHFARDQRIHVGYFSGTPTHRRDFAIISGLLAQFMAREPRLVLRIVGFLELDPALTAFDGRVEVFPLQDFVNLQRLIGEVEINLVPLQDNAFTNCKSELKVFEASAVGTISIASPSFTLRGAIRDQVTGYLAPAHEWEHILGTAIAAIDDHVPMALAAAADALDRYTPRAQAAAVLAAVFGDGPSGSTGSSAELHPA